jgi:uncharacterized membrane protein (UPF0136 family)
MDVIGIGAAQAASLFAATVLLVVFFLIARVMRARQPIALAFATMPLLLSWALPGVATAVLRLA